MVAAAPARRGGRGVRVQPGDLALRGDAGEQPNDSAFHMEMVRWADHQIGEGKVPLDGWFPNLGLGSSFFHHYQSLPYTITAYTARITGLERPDHLPLVPVSAARTVADLDLPRRAAAELGSMAGGRRGARLAAHRQRDGLRLRARQLHVAGPRRVHAALRYVALAARVGSHVARGRQGQGLRTDRPGARAHDRDAPHDGLSRAAHDRRLGAAPMERDLAAHRPGRGRLDRRARSPRRG